MHCVYSIRFSSPCLLIIQWWIQKFCLGCGMGGSRESADRPLPPGTASGGYNGAHDGWCVSLRRFVAGATNGSTPKSPLRLVLLDEGGALNKPPSSPGSASNGYNAIRSNSLYTDRCTRFKARQTDLFVLLQSSILSSLRNDRAIFLSAKNVQSAFLRCLLRNWRKLIGSCEHFLGCLWSGENLPFWRIEEKGSWTKETNVFEQTKTKQHCEFYLETLNRVGEFVWKGKERLGISCISGLCVCWNHRNGECHWSQMHVVGNKALASGTGSESKDGNIYGCQEFCKQVPNNLSFAPDENGIFLPTELYVVHFLASRLCSVESVELDPVGHSQRYLSYQCDYLEWKKVSLFLSEPGVHTVLLPLLLKLRHTQCLFSWQRYLSDSSGGNRLMQSLLVNKLKWFIPWNFLLWFHILKLKLNLLPAWQNRKS